MPNKYPGTCYRCGERVEAGKGVFEKIGKRQVAKWGNFTRNRWHVQHHDCAAEWRGTAQHYLHNDLRKKADGPV